MKLLLDNNLSPKLVGRLAALYPGIDHVALCDLASAPDAVVWTFARDGGFCLVTKDSDFNDLLAARGFPPKVIWLRMGNCTTDTIAALLKAQQETITAFLGDDAYGLLELQ